MLSHYLANLSGLIVLNQNRRLPQAACLPVATGGYNLSLRNWAIHAIAETEKMGLGRFPGNRYQFVTCRLGFYERNIKLTQLTHFLLEKNNKARHQGQSLKTLWRYLEKHIDRLNYKKFLENGWPIGSGAIESAHRWVLQKRMKQAGMKWSKENAQRMASARALYASVGPKNLFYDYLLKADARAA